MDAKVQDLVDAIVALCGKTDKVHVREWLNGGACRGTIKRRVVQSKSKYSDECGVFGLVMDAYHRMGENLELYSEEGQRRFAKVFTQAIKQLVAAGHKVSIANRLAFEQAVYSGEGGRGGKPYMKMYGCSRDFNDLTDVEVETEIVESEAQTLMRKNPERREPVGRVTSIHCPYCGNEVVISNTEDGYLPLMDENGEPYRIMD